MKLTLALPVSALVLAAGVATASAASDVEEAFARLDANSDGEVTWAEAYKVRTSQFTGMDKNRDGIVEADEFGGRKLPLSAFDTDGDGRLQLAEYVGKHHRMFGKFDADGTGTIDLAEFETAQKAVSNG